MTKTTPAIDEFSLGDTVLVDRLPSLKATVCGYGMVQYKTGVETVVLVKLGGGGVPQALRPERLAKRKVSMSRKT